jgi:hypothetical protein
MTYQYWNSRNDEMSQSMPFRCKTLTSSHLRHGQYLLFKPQVRKKLCRPLAIFHGIFIWSPPPKKSKYQSWYLTPCCGLEVQKPAQALKSVKGLGNTFDLNPKWERTLPSVGNFSWDIYRVPPPQIQISKLIFDTMLWAWGAETNPGT